MNSKRCTIDYTDDQSFSGGVCLHCGDWRSNHPGTMPALQELAWEASRKKSLTEG